MERLTVDVRRVKAAVTIRRGRGTEIAVGNPFGLRGGVPPADEGAGTEYCNARADECSPGHITCGERAVYFRGTEYRVIGFYFMSAPTGGCDLCYILRAASHDYRTPFSAKPVLADFAG